MKCGWEVGWGGSVFAELATEVAELVLGGDGLVGVRALLAFGLFLLGAARCRPGREPCLLFLVERGQRGAHETGVGFEIGHEARVITEHFLFAGEAAQGIPGRHKSLKGEFLRPVDVTNRENQAGRIRLQRGGQDDDVHQREAARRPDSMLAITLRGMGCPSSSHRSARSCALHPISFLLRRTSPATFAWTRSTHSGKSSSSSSEWRCVMQTH